MTDRSVTKHLRGQGFAWFRQQGGPRPWWVIVVAGYGAFLFVGTEAEAEEMRAHKANWERGAGHKRQASITDFERPSGCWNHPGFARTRKLWRYGSRGRLLKRPFAPRFHCDCGVCSND